MSAAQDVDVQMSRLESTLTDTQQQLVEQTRQVRSASQDAIWARKDAAKAVRERDQARQELAAAVAELGAARWAARVAAAEAAAAVRPVTADPDPVTRLALAVGVNRGFDSKASGLVSGAGVLTAVAAVAGATTHPLLVPALVCGTALVVALVTSLAVLAPRGGSPAVWLPTQDPAGELAKVTAIAVTKHRLLRVAVAALTTSVIAGATAVALGSLGGIR